MKIVLHMHGHADIWALGISDKPNSKTKKKKCFNWQKKQIFENDQWTGKLSQILSSKLSLHDFWMNSAREVIHKDWMNWRSF